MTISAHPTEFAGLPIRSFDGPDDWAGPDFAYRLAITWDDPPEAFEEKLQQFVSCPCEDVEALVIGAWHGDDSSLPSDDVIRHLVACKEVLPSLKALFLGDITYDENEISWIQQSDVAPLLHAFPTLEHFRVRGGTGLKLTPLRHEQLTQLIIETGGLPRQVLRELWQCDFPHLQHLELWLGEANYGFDGGAEDLQPLLAGQRFPRLSYLGLRNSEIVDELAAVLVNAPLVQRLRVLDLSNGTLTDAGGQALLRLPANLPLEELNLSHHYLTEAMAAQLKQTLHCRVVAEDGQDPNSEWRAIVVSE